MQDTRHSYLGVRLHPHELQKIKQMAEDERLLPATWVRKILLDLADGKLRLVQVHQSVSPRTDLPSSLL